MNQFTIISNDCWGNSIYKNLKIPYNTPFIAAFIQPQQYVDLLEQFPDILKEKIIFKKGSPTVANLGGICDIVFLHYASLEEAEEKWHKRLSRMNIKEADNFIYKIWITNVGIYKHCGNYDHLKVLERFHNLRFKYKISFTDKNYCDFEHPNNVCVSNCPCAISLWNQTKNMPIVKNLFKCSSNFEI